MTHVHPLEGAETLSAVVVGAVLATVGGFAATQLEAFLRRRARERSAALLFGEILAVLDVLLAMAGDARGHGEPYGSLTMRFLRAVRRETDTYDRNREALYDLRDGGIRARIHTLMVRLTLALDGVSDTTEQIAAADGAVFALDPDDPARIEALARCDALRERRDAAFDFAMETAAKISPIVASLRPLAKHSFDAHAAVARGL